ncbi:hypothetical protein HYDPIDRAFT_110303 [Hydnomerulius pinastri MD-312]|nr:hypothetical protein HYDPIDRAFT_110303 [Hydnomerulius pinastri MD-312]
MLLCDYSYYPVVPKIYSTITRFPISQLDMGSRAHPLESSSSCAGIVIDGDDQLYIPLNDDIEGYISGIYILEGIAPSQSSFFNSLCQSQGEQQEPSAPLMDLQPSQRVDHASLSDILGPVVLSPASTPTLPQAHWQEAGTSVFPRSIEELLGCLEQQKRDIMHGLPPSVPPGVLLMHPQDQQGRAISQSPRAVSPVPQKLSSAIRTTTSYSNIRLNHCNSSKTAIHSCEWRHDDGSICGESISFMTCPEHLAVHGIKNMAFNLLINCGWCGKPVKRESIVRHVREAHLRVRRTVTYPPSPHGDRAPYWT